MRYDLEGMFWKDEVTHSVRNAKVTRKLAPIPDTGWEMPEYFPDLSSAKIIAIDCESKDPDISNGPGFVRGKAHIVGLSVATDDGFSAYYPFAHEVGNNMDKNIVLKWAKDQLSRPNQLKIGHNLIYDLEGLSCAGVEVDGPLWDTMYAETLLNENRPSYSLEAIAQLRLGEGKESDEMHKWAARSYGGNPTRKDQAGNIYRTPACLVGPYAESDTILPLRLYEIQKGLLEEEGLTKLMELECRNIRLLLAMRKRGVSVDIAKTERLHKWLQDNIKTQQQIIGNVDIWAAESVAKCCQKHGIRYEVTVKGNPSFTTAWFNKQTHPLAQAIFQLRKLSKFNGTFIEGYILNSHVNGKVYGQFHPMRNDEFGTVSGRFSSSNPNLQNIPSRDPFIVDLGDKKLRLGNAVRALFVPEEDCDWVKDDYSQVEYRILTHYAKGPSAEFAREKYNEDSTTDFHQLVAEMCHIERGSAKSINFGLAYGMGEEKLARELGVSQEEAKALFEQYHELVPFVKSIQRDAASAASNRGYIKTILGRRARFDLWESTTWNQDKIPPQNLESAKMIWDGKIRRAHTHKALNRLIQGSAADVMKAAMDKIHTSGIMDALGAPHLTVHDELDWSIPRTKEGKEAHREAVFMMENAIKFKVPLLVESKIGPNWGETKHE